MAGGATEVSAATATAQTTRTGTGAPPHLSFRLDIEGMRAVAVLLVVLSHIGLGTVAGGYVGVDVFFVISGFLITSLLLKELRTTGSISIASFYARRAARLLPASTLVLVATLGAAWLWLSPIRLTSIMGDAVASALYGINYRLAIQGTDYWNADTEPSPLQHYWSLAVEEQFYFIWPLLLLVSSLVWWRRRGDRPGRIDLRVVSAVLVAVAVVSFVASVEQTPRLVSWAYFGLHTRAWELALGALIAVGAGVLSRTPAPAAAVLTWTGLAAVVWSAVTFDETTVFPGAAAAVPVLGTGLVIAGGCAAHRAGAQALLRLAPFQFIGKRSYGWYLWHWPVLMIGPAALGREPSLRLNAALAVVALGLSAASYALVENPVRNRRSLRLVPRRGLAMGAGLTATAVAIAVAVAVFAPTSLGKGEAPDTANTLAGTTDPFTELRQLIARSATVRDVPANLVPSLAEAADDKVTLDDEGCHLGFTEMEQTGPCIYGDPDADTTVVLFGDSHAAQWFPTLEQIADDEGWRLLPMTKSACHASSVELWNSQMDRMYDECTQWRTDTLAAIRDLEPDLVVMSSIDGGSSDLAGEHADPDQVWAQGWIESFRQVVGPRTEGVLLLDTPRPGNNVPECLSENLTDMSQCAAATTDLSREPARRQLVAQQVAAEGVTVVDPVPWFCTDQLCPPVIGNVLVYRDTNHISVTYGRLLAPLLMPQFRSLERGAGVSTG